MSDRIAALPCLPRLPTDTFIRRANGRLDRIPEGYVDTWFLKHDYKISDLQLKSLQTRHVLNPTAKTQYGYPCYKRSDVEAVLRSPEHLMVTVKAVRPKKLPQGVYTDAQGAAYLQRVHAGQDPARVQVELGLSPLALANLQADQAKALGTVLLSPATMAVIQRAGFDGEPITTDDQVRTAFQALLAARMCKQCLIRKCVSVCATCADQIARERLAKGTAGASSSPEPRRARTPRPAKPSRSKTRDERGSAYADQ